MRTPDTYQRTTIAELQALVARAAEKVPELGARPEKAATILLSGKVAAIDVDTYEVVSSDGTDAYLVDHAAGTCPCPDFKHRAPTVNGAKLCKHRLAVIFLRRLGTPSTRPSARAARVATFRRVTRRQLRKAA